ncbi:FliI/YscN family ATPase [Legionella sp. CNM-4043-24]|uniref:FliI/YscN family ATPase n=1 Tax=Legionella sp. CNM-4043-24 TaxID=3421646 RepID=UPI00403AE691
MSVIASLKRTLHRLNDGVDRAQDVIAYGTVVRISGFMLEAAGLHVSVGTVCRIYLTGSDRNVMAEVIGFSDDCTYLMAYEEINGILPGSKIACVAKSLRVPVGKMLRGRVLNGLCEPIDNKGPLHASLFYELQAQTLNPIERTRISQPIDVGVRAINALISVGQGQRLGVFAGSGVGKSVLLGMITRFTQADVVVVGLIGERGREVKEFIEENIGLDNLEKTVIVAAPVDTSPLMRANGAMVATTIAEYYRDQGLNVLLIIDSLTRYAQALRQVYLTLGEMPSAKGFSPSVFSKISQLVERTGNGSEGQGSITAFYTVLTEGDDMNDPVADHARSILDGHVVLSRRLADSGHYPAIDISSSISRVMTSIMDDEHLERVQRFKRLYSAWQQNQDLIKMGMYHPGSDRVVDESITYHDRMLAYLTQGINEQANMARDLAELAGLFR